MEKTKRINKLILDREAVLQHFPAGLRIAEIGVLRGRYSKKIITANPSKLFLIDCWKHIEDGDSVYVKHDGCNVDDEKQEKKYQHVLKMFKDDSRVEIIRKLSTDAVHHFPDSSLDAVYIDGDHSYQGCLADLRAYSKKISDNGFMWGHDYTTNYKWIQVIQAIETFVQESPEWELLCITSEIPKKSPSWFLVKAGSCILPAFEKLDAKIAEIGYREL